ncbi:MAG: hypothetical protein HIU86_12175 [Acidobacteria bacterium]|nr:hypothetical protein [Acidobacteriota bacterium]
MLRSVFAALITVGTLSVGLAACSSAPAGVGSDHFSSTTVHADGAIESAARAHPIQLWFEQQNGSLALIANGPANTYDIPVSQQGATITPDATHEAGSSVGCSRPTDACTLDHWSSIWITKPFNLVLHGDQLLLTQGTTSIELTRD